jgi:hypothetical protein
MPNNGWISVYDSQKPESCEEVLTLSYTGDFPAPEDMFALPEDRAYCVCTYFYPGDEDVNEVPGDPRKGIPTEFTPIVFDREGFYLLDCIGPRQAAVWHRLDDLCDGSSRGIICWKHLDYPTVD